MATETMKQYGYVLEMPTGEGGNEPHAIGQVKQCERCKQPFVVKRDPTRDECLYHWGRAFTKNINGIPRFYGSFFLTF